MSADNLNPDALPAHIDASQVSDDLSTPATNGTATLQETLVNSTSSAVNTVKDHPVTQNLVNGKSSRPDTHIIHWLNHVPGPVAASIKNEAEATSSEFNDLASSRQTPSYAAANDTPLTHYHSFFYTLLSWKNKRATGITFLSVVALIFACRYLPVLRYSLKLTWSVLGVVTLAEVASKTVTGSSLTSAVRPRRYYKIPKETLEASLDDLENLINFFVIEAQRIVFAENILVTGATFFAALVSYYLIKLLPLWGFILLSTVVLFTAPLIYIENKEFVDAQLDEAAKVIGQQTSQLKDLTAQHTSKGLDTVKQYTGAYTAKAQDLVGNIGASRQKIPPQPAVKAESFPTAPKTELPKPEQEPLLAE
ncbi:hypothetical protein, variant 2 [Exophiala mesophila]|uniref:Reticulon-like protein n=1 Tax=Exophiala mesophila TaxID=212818 RepID=A0A0D1ZLM5_EXOME|nr:hypothetical protein, variant 2 [Exophiala mesophila]KIV94844.1 hypothetical protein, variant 2 [Exophiala mesophila]